MVLDQEERFTNPPHGGGSEALTGQRSKGRNFNKGKGKASPEKPLEKKLDSEQEKLKADRSCHECGEKGHYWRKCPKRTGKSADTSATTAKTPAFVHLEMVDSDASSSSSEEAVGLTAKDTREWILDSGASRHMTPSRDFFLDLKRQSGRIYIGDNSTIPIHSEGRMEIIPDGKGGKHASRVLYVPDLGFHLLSVHEVCKTGFRVEFEAHSVALRDLVTGKVVWEGGVENGIYKLSALSSLTGSQVGDLWHFRFGHLNVDALRRAFRDQMVVGLPDVGNRQGRCSSCIRGKQHRESFPK